MAVKKNILKKLSNTKKYINLTMKRGGKDWQSLIVQNLVEARDDCYRGLSADIYAEYGELYDLVLSAVDEIVLSGDYAKGLSLCQEMVCCIEEKTAQEQSFKKDVVFLPYQISMWDSLASIWEAARNDEKWNTYVIPIPYCERNKDRTASEWFCDRDKFPADVPTLSWQEVDLYEWHPDMIFIHNPYDEYNYITSVDERYYSRNLKLCTDKLVYIPYYIYDEPDFTVSDNPLEGKKELVAAPAVENADIVVVQSENMREATIRLMMREKGGDRLYWEKKIWGTGSPKLDQLAAGSEAQYELPEEWKRLIGDRKVYLYNTTIGAVLKYQGKYFHKLRSVLETFRRHSDVVLWWRPHPLLKSTFHSLSQDLQQEYEAIVTKYTEEGWGIFDDTPELNRAIACTDAYYGDRSSLVHLYKLLGKPIMIQDVTVVNEYAD